MGGTSASRPTRHAPVEDVRRAAGSYKTVLASMGNSASVPGDSRASWPGLPRARVLAQRYNGTSRLMQRTQAIIGSAIFLLLAPGIIAVLVPWLICRWQLDPPLLGLSFLRVIGALCILCGLPILLDSFVRFALEGLGTPAPIAPTERLVVSGMYRHVRNPMYVGVTLIIFGQGLFFGSAAVLLFGAAAWGVEAVFVLCYEEPKLRETFGEEYEKFRAKVPRWIPRLRPWRGKGGG